jgi:glutamyl/glutaminyl-tRNA synthetase
MAGLNWNEQYKQSECIALYRQMADAIMKKGMAYRDFTPAHTRESDKSGAHRGPDLSPLRSSDSFEAEPYHSAVREK